MTLIDLTQILNQSTPVYPGDPKPCFEQIASLPKDSFNDFKLTFGMHVGTHIDAPFHMIENGKKISEIESEKFIGRGVMVDFKNLSAYDIEEGDIVLIKTGFSDRFNSPEYFENYPQLPKEFAEELVKLKVKMAGFDSPSPDKPPFEIHKLLLGNGILIIENLTNFDKLVGKEFEIMAFPTKFETDAAPARVIVKIKN